MIESMRRIGRASTRAGQSNLHFTTSHLSPVPSEYSGLHPVSLMNGYMPLLSLSDDELPPPEVCCPSPDGVELPPCPLSGFLLPVSPASSVVSSADTEAEALNVLGDGELPLAGGSLLVANADGEDGEVVDLYRNAL